MKDLIIDFETMGVPPVKPRSTQVFPRLAPQ